ncbi:MAG: hypothetical protein JG774_94 [Desulfomicrobiaceae bacterium]|nr:hypothetical protein [Desulfomicrobiaceae bacterium]
MVGGVDWAILGRAVAVWAVLLVVAVASGGVREIVLVPRLGAALALTVGGLWLCFAVVAVAYGAAPWLGVREGRGLLLLGLGWLGLTLAFETIFGLARGQTLAELGAAYSFRGGNLWPVVLVVIVFAPCLAAWLRGWR